MKTTHQLEPWYPYVFQMTYIDLCTCIPSSKSYLILPYLYPRY